MSYSFQVRAANKAEARAAAEAEFDKVVESQPIHAKDKAAALANIDMASSIIEGDGDEANDVVIHCNGSVSYKYDPNSEQKDWPVYGVNVSASVSLQPKA